jgi:sucrose phosphorylase
VPAATFDDGLTNWYDSGRGWTAQQDKLVLTLQPYDVLWLTPFAELERSIEPPA